TARSARRPNRRREVGPVIRPPSRTEPKVVEAAGVEPASQGAAPKTSTLVVDPRTTSAAGLRSTGPADSSAPGSHRRRRGEASATSLLSGGTRPPAGEEHGPWLPFS